MKGVETKDKIKKEFIEWCDTPMSADANDREEMFERIWQQALSLQKQGIVEEMEKFIKKTTTRGMVYDGVRSKEILDYLKQTLT